jgi:heterotetrameric sarcosine oxidase delta subunit
MSFLLACPACDNGPRPVEEFYCAGEVTSRPKADPSARELNSYIYFRRNVAGIHREWWFCRACESWFLAERDTRTNEVRRTWLPERPAATPAEPRPVGGAEAL